MAKVLGLKELTALGIGGMIGGGSFVYLEKAFRNHHVGGFGEWILSIGCVGYAFPLRLYVWGLMARPC